MNDKDLDKLENALNEWSEKGIELDKEFFDFYIQLEKKYKIPYDYRDIFKSLIFKVGNEIFPWKEPQFGE